MRVFFICLLTLATFSSLHAAEYTQATDIIQAEGEFVTTDGSSYFSFRKDGTFSSGPLSMSGRQIEGRWKYDGANRFLIEGLWSWMNGVSQINDRRRLVMGIQPPFSLQIQDSKNPFIPHAAKTPLHVYQCYLTIEELVKLDDKK